MKKLIGTVALAALLAGSAFAELSMGAWVRTVVAPVASDGEDIVTGWENSWGYGVRNARISFNYTSDDEKVGMMYDVFSGDDSGISIGDYCAGWYRPFDWLKFMVGKIDNGYTMRSDLCFGSWNWMRPNNWINDDEGLTFNLGNVDGLQIELFPVEGLQVVARLGLPLNNSDKDEYYTYDEQGNKNYIGMGGYYRDAYMAYGNGDVAVGYTIGDIGTIKAAFLGEYAEAGDAKDYGKVAAAFDLTGIENLYVTVGVRIHMANSDWKDNMTAGLIGGGSDFDFLNAALGASYQILDNLKVSANFVVQTYENLDPSFQFGVGLDVGLTDTLSLAADFRGLLPGGYDKNGYKVEPDPSFSFLVGLNWGFSSNGSIGVGFQGLISGEQSQKVQNCVFPAYNDKFAWAVPVAFSYWF